MDNYTDVITQMGFPQLITVRPPIPVTCIARPTVGGLVAPYINAQLADGGIDFRTQHQKRYAEVLTNDCCQVCANPLRGLAVLFGGPRSLATRHFGEPPICGPCALYVSRACPMVAGRLERFADRERLTEGHRGETCAEPGCQCGGWTSIGSHDRSTAGQPAHPWYALYVYRGDYQVTAAQTTVRCSDRGCEHERLVLNGVMLTSRSVKAMVVSEPGQGRVWRRLTDAELGELLGPLPELTS